MKEFLRKTFLIIFTALLLVPATFSQEELTLRDADELLGEDNVAKAIDFFKTKVAEEPENPDYQMRLGICYFVTPNEKEKSTAYLKKAAELYQAQKKVRKWKATNYYEAKFYWAKSLSTNYKYDEAQVVFKELKRELKRKKKMKRIVQHEIDICKTGLKLMKDSVDVVIKSVPEINTPYDEHTPVLTVDGKSMVFTSKRMNGGTDELKPDGQYSEDIFITNHEGNKWSEPKIVSNKLATGAHEANCGFAPDGKRLYIYTLADIYFSDLNDDGTWTTPAPFLEQINSKRKENHICTDEDETVIYFSSSRRGGFGGLDIYKMEKDDKGYWGKPINLGKNINTEYDDDGPFIHENGTLYFTSKGHETIGGYDVFKATPDGKGNFKKAKNLGMPINSSEDEVYFFMSKDQKQGYFSSTRRGGAGRSDIYVADFADSSKYYLLVKGDVRKEGGGNDSISVSITDIASKEKVENVSMQRGSYTNVVQKGKNYEAVFESDGFFFETRSLSAPPDSAHEREYPDVELQKIHKGNARKEYSIDFDNSSSTKIEDENEIFMNTLATFMTNNPDLNVDISSGGENDSKNRKKRNEKLLSYLKDKGIDEKRVYVDITKNNKGNENSTKITIMDEMTLASAYNQKTKDNPPTVDDLSTGNKISGDYTIQVGAFRKIKTANDPFFKEISGKVRMKKGADKINRFTYGKYDFKSDAQKNLEIIHNMGFTDAFIRELKWYE